MPSALPDVVRYHLPWAAKAHSQQPEREKAGSGVRDQTWEPVAGEGKSELVRAGLEK